MNKRLLSRLARYSLQPNRRSIENFTTEILAHLFNEDPSFRKRFLRVAIPDRRLARAFAAGRARTQVVFPRCIADIVLDGRRGRQHLIEVKIAARESLGEDDAGRVRSQIDRYLDLRRGHVTFLTTRFTRDHQADLRGRTHRVHHALFEHLHAAIKPARRGEMGKAFVEFMEEQGMAPTEPLTRAELRLGEAAAAVHRKCIDLLAQLRQEIEPEFRQNLRCRGFLASPRLKHGPDWAFYDCCLLGLRNRGPVRTAGFGLAPDADGTWFSVYVWGIRTAELARLGKDLGWEDMGDGKGFESYFKLRGTPGDIHRMRTTVRQKSRRLGRAIAKRFT